jgi:hypothetical protein
MRNHLVNSQDVVPSDPTNGTTYGSYEIKLISSYCSVKPKTEEQEEMIICIFSTSTSCSTKGLTEQHVNKLKRPKLKILSRFSPSKSTTILILVAVHQTIYPSDHPSDRRKWSLIEPLARI